MTVGKEVSITLVRSLIGRRQDHRAAVHSLGLRRLHHTVRLPDTPQLRGQIRKVGYLLKVQS